MPCMLNVQLKKEPAGQLILDRECASRLGLQKLSDIDLSAISALITCKPVSVTEATLSILNNTMPIVEKSVRVDFILTNPRSGRLKFMHRPGKPRVESCTNICIFRLSYHFHDILYIAGGQLSISPVDLYAARAACFEHLTFNAYFRTFQIKNQNRALNLGHAEVNIATPGHGLHLESALDDPVGYLDIANTTDAFGNQVVQRKGLVRFSHHHPAYAPDGFFYNVLLEKVIQFLVILLTYYFCDLLITMCQHQTFCNTCICILQVAFRIEDDLLEHPAAVGSHF